MSPRTGILPQFSLRALFCLVLASAVLLASWRAFGQAVAVSLVIAAMLAAPIAVIEGPWKRACWVACLAVYGPFIVMATYTLLYVSCDHCKQAVWVLLPFAPGLVPFHLARGWLSLSWVSETLEFGIALCFSLALVVGLAWLVRRFRWWGASTAAATLLYGAFAAVAILAAVRS